MKSKTIQTTYNGVEITFDDDREVWRYTLNGVEKSTAKLSVAKHAIDHPPKAKFKPIPCLLKERWGTKICEAEITSIAEKRYSFQQETEVWVNIKGSGPIKREKVKLHNCIALTSGNKVILREIEDTRVEIDNLNKKEASLKESLIKVKLNLPETQ